MKTTYTEQVNSILLSSPNPSDGQPKGNNTSDTTGDKAVRLNSEFMTRLLEKIIAVETVYFRLSGEEQKFIRQYFFEGRRYLDCDVFYSERAMHNIKHKIVQDVAILLKEIR